MALHILEYPERITREQLAEAMVALGLDADRVKAVEMGTDGYTAEVYIEDLAGRRRPDTVRITVPVYDLGERR